MFSKTVLRIATTLVLSCVFFLGTMIAPAQADHHGNMITAQPLFPVEATVDYEYDCTPSCIGSPATQIMVGIVDPESQDYPDAESIKCINVGMPLYEKPVTGSANLSIYTPMGLVDGASKNHSYDVRFRLLPEGSGNCNASEASWWTEEESAKIGVVNVIVNTTDDDLATVYRTPDTGWAGASETLGKVTLSNFVFTTGTYNPNPTAIPATNIKKQRKNKQRNKNKWIKF